MVITNEGFSNPIADPSIQKREPQFTCLTHHLCSYSLPMLQQIEHIESKLFHKKLRTK